MRWPKSVMVRTLVVLVIVLASGGWTALGARLDLPRCCGEGERLAAELVPAGADGARAAAACQPAPEAVWAPRVYAPARNIFLEPGQLPSHWRPAARSIPACQSLRAISDHSAPYVLLANNGSLWVRTAGRSLPPARYCVDVSAALVCAGDVPQLPTKCCATSRVWDGARCVVDEARAEAVRKELVALAGAVTGGWPACAAGARYAVLGALAEGKMAPDGSLQLGETPLPGGAWCAEAVPGEEGARVLACEEAAPAPPPEDHLTLYGAALAVGALFLLATLAVSLALPAHHALHWRCQTHYVAALMAGDALLAAVQLAGASVPPTLCRVLAVCMHFLFLSAFFWLNTMCFNIWWTFRDFRPTSTERRQEAWRLRVYSLYAWGVPLAMAGTGAALDAAPAAHHLLRPRFGERHCWFYGDAEILVYFFGPVGVLLLVNLALFASTTRQLTCGFWRRDEVKSTSERAALGRVCANLVVVMGVTWGADVVSWAAGGPRALWYVTDLLNALQGLLIFIVVGCQRSALRAVRGWWRARRPAPHTHSSSQLPSCGESLTHTTPAPPAPAPAPALAPARPPMETVC